MTIGVTRRAPDLPFVPRELVGQHVMAIAVCYAGDLEEGERVLRPLRSFGSPASIVCAAKPFVAHQQMFDPSFEPGWWYYVRSLRRRRAERRRDRHRGRLRLTHQLTDQQHCPVADGRRRRHAWPTTRRPSMAATPASPSTSSDDRDTRSPDPRPQRVARAGGWKPGRSDRPARTTRERSVNRSGRRPLARQRERRPRRPMRRRRRVEPRRDQPFVLSLDEGLCDSAGATMAVDEQELDFEAPARGSAEELLDAEAGDPLDPMRHSAAHVMAEAVMDLFPGTRLGIGPAISGGFYYDFELPRR
jgi:hypothetical protein